jgi:hypothetical protein
MTPSATTMRAMDGGDRTSRNEADIEREHARQVLRLPYQMNQVMDE